MLAATFKLLKSQIQQTHMLYPSPIWRSQSNKEQVEQTHLLTGDSPLTTMSTATGGRKNRILNCVFDRHTLVTYSACRNILHSHKEINGLLDFLRCKALSVYLLFHNFDTDIEIEKYNSTRREQWSSHAAGVRVAMSRGWWGLPWAQESVCLSQQKLPDGNVGLCVAGSSKFETDWKYRFLSEI